MRDRIKAEIDRDCKAKKRGNPDTCPPNSLMAYSKTIKPIEGEIPTFKPVCWQCHENDSLADRIADLVPPEVKR